MPDHLPDVLQSAGLTPHEVGWIQLHVEPVLRGEDGRAVAELWMQAAFHPPGGGRVELVDAATGSVLAEAPLPAVSGGGALRWRIPLQLAAGITAVRVQVEAAVPDEATRLRAPWKLLDTIELRMPEEDAGGGLELAAKLGAVALGGVAGAAVVAATTSRPSRPGIQRPSGMKVHPARVTLRELVSDVVAAGPEESFSAAIETLWMPGEPVDGEALKKRLRAHRPSGPVCPNCGAVLVPGGEFCPRCLGPVAAAARAESAASAYPPLASMAPHLAARNAEAAEPQAQAPEEEVARCSLHPERSSTGACNRCEKLFCEECASADSPGLCAKCSEEEHQRVRAVVMAPQVYRDASIVHLALFFGLVLRPFIGVALEYRHVFTVIDALPFAGLGVLLFGFRRPFALLVALGVDALVLVDSYATDDWSRLFLAVAGLALTGMLWLRLPDPDSLPQQQT